MQLNLIHLHIMYGILTALSLPPIQPPVINVKSIVNKAVNNAFRNKAIADKG